MKAKIRKTKDVKNRVSKALETNNNRLATVSIFAYRITINLIVVANKSNDDRDIRQPRLH